MNELKQQVKTQPLENWPRWAELHVVHNPDHAVEVRYLNNGIYYECTSDHCAWWNHELT